MRLYYAFLPLNASLDFIILYLKNKFVLLFFFLRSRPTVKSISAINNALLTK